MTLPPALAIAWDGGGDGRLVKLDGEVVVVRSSKPFAPGSRPTGSIGGTDAFRMKTHRCKRDPAEMTAEDGLSFTIEGRSLDMPKALRARLLERLAELASA